VERVGTNVLLQIVRGRDDSGEIVRYRGVLIDSMGVWEGRGWKGSTALPDLEG